MASYQRMSSVQKERLLALVESDAILQNNYRGVRTKEQSDLAWDRVAWEMNLMPGAQRDGQGWRKCYKDAVRLKQERESKPLNPEVQLMEYENSSMDMMNLVVDEPDPSVQETPPRKKRRNVDAEATKKMLVECLKKRPFLVHAQSITPAQRRQNLRGWRAVAGEMEKGVNDSRTAKQWKMYWHDCKKAMKRLVMRIKWEESNKLPTGGMKTVLRGIEEDILRLMVSKEAREATEAPDEQDNYGSDPSDGFNAISSGDDNMELEERSSRTMNGSVKEEAVQTSTVKVVEELQKLTHQVARTSDNGDVARELKRVRVAMTNQHNALLQEMKNLTNAVISITDALDRAKKLFPPHT